MAKSCVVYLATSLRDLMLRLRTSVNSAEMNSSVWLEKESSARLMAAFWEGERSREARFLSVEVDVS